VEQNGGKKAEKGGKISAECVESGLELAQKRNQRSRSGIGRLRQSEESPGRELRVDPKMDQNFHGRNRIP
jgi:hypothetical protein